MCSPVRRKMCRWTSHAPPRPERETHCTVACASQVSSCLACLPSVLMAAALDFRPPACPPTRHHNPSKGLHLAILIAAAGPFKITELIHHLLTWHLLHQLGTADGTRRRMTSVRLYCTLPFACLAGPTQRARVTLCAFAVIKRCLGREKEKNLFGEPFRHVFSGERALVAGTMAYISRDGGFEGSTA
jgi:hypothetical protein